MAGRAVVTGAGGFVGAALVRRLLADGWETHALLRPGVDYWRLAGLSADVAEHRVLLEEADGAAEVIAEIRPDRIFNLAAHGAYSSQQDAERMWRTNVALTVNLVRAAAAAGGCEAFVQAGSSSEYGFKDHPPSEDEAPAPNSDYAVTKAAATLFCGYAGRRLGLPTVTLRLYSVYGEWEEPSRLMPTLLVRALEGRLPSLADPATARDFVHVDDVLNAFLLAAEVAATRPGAVYNIGSGSQTTLADLVESARRLFGVAQEPVWASLPSRSWDTATWVANPSLAAAELGWRPMIPLDDGMRRTAAWLQESAERLERYRAHAAGA